MMEIEKIEARWAALQSRPGGWFKVPGCSDPAEDVAALVARVGELEAMVEDSREAEPDRVPSFEAVLEDGTRKRVPVPVVTIPEGDED